MVTQWTVFVIVLISNAVLAAAIAILLNRRQSAPGRDALIWMLFGLAVWAFGYAMITVFPSLEEKIFWLRIENIGILTVPVFWFLFTVQYAQVDKWLSRYTGALFFDQDGTGGLAQVQIASLSTGLALTHNNIVVLS